MAQYGTVYVDERYSAIVAPNLYGQSTLQPKITYNDAYQGDAASGLVKIPRIVRDGNGDPKPPASDFSHETAANVLLDLRLNNGFFKSKKIYGIAAASVNYKLAEAQLATSTQDARQDWQRSGLACLIKEGTADTDTSALTKANLKQRIVAARAALRAKHAMPDVLTLSVGAFAAFLEFAGSEYTPDKNNEVATTGRSGSWLGFRVCEADLIDGAVNKYFDNAGVLQTVDMTKVDFVMYDHLAFAVVNHLETIRIVDAVDFVGSYAQVNINSGYRVNNADMVLVHQHA